MFRLSICVNLRGLLTLPVSLKFYSRSESENVLHLVYPSVCMCVCLCVSVYCVCLCICLCVCVCLYMYVFMCVMSVCVSVCVLLEMEVRASNLLASAIPLNSSLLTKTKKNVQNQTVLVRTEQKRIKKACIWFLLLTNFNINIQFYFS